VSDCLHQLLLLLLLMLLAAGRCTAWWLPLPLSALPTVLRSGRL